MLEIHQILPIEWARTSREVHAQVHGKDKPATWDRIDYALLITKGPEAVAYVTVRELDHESVYWQFGGGFPWAQKSTLMVKSFRLFVQWQLARSKRIGMLVENGNVPMLKLGLAEGFRILGTRLYRTTLLVEMGREKSEHQEDLPTNSQQ